MQPDPPDVSGPVPLPHPPGPDDHSDPFGPAGREAGHGDGPAPRLIEPERTLDPRVVGVWRITAAIPGVPLAAAGAYLAVIAFLNDAPTLVLLLASGLVCLAAAYVLVVVWPRKRHSLYRWTIRPEGVIIRRGWLWRKLVIVPHSRIQAVDADAGPLLRRAGLASLHVRTASGPGSPHIPGIDAEEAEELTRHIASRADAFDAT